MQPPESPYTGPRSTLARPLPSFGRRLLLLPIAPAFWRRCADLALVDVAAPLLVLALGVGLATGLIAAPRLQAFLHEVAEGYDERADPLVYENQRFALEGERILFWQRDQFTVLIDPERTLPDSSVSSAQFVIVRDDEVIVQQPGRELERHAADDLEPFFGEERVVIDGARIKSFADRIAYPAVILFMAIFGSFMEFASCVLYAGVAGAVARLVRGQWLGLSFAACFQVALAASAATLVAGLLLSAFQILSPLPGVLLWPVLLSALTLWALAQDSETQSLPDSQ
jgi:hypothetical protein